MPITDILLLSFFIFAFVLIMAALAWGDYQTHDIAKKSRAAALAGTPAKVVEKSAVVVDGRKEPNRLVHVRAAT